MDGHMLLFKWFLTSNEAFDRDLREVPKVVLSGASFSWCSFAILLSICFFAGWVTLHYAHAGGGPARLQRTLDMCTMRARCCMEYIEAPSSEDMSSDEPLLSLLSEYEGREDQEGECQQAIANYVRLCSVEWKRAEKELRQSWAGIAGWLDVECQETWGEYRKEFLLFGLLHGLLGFVRTLMWRDSFPHAWGLLQSRVAMQVGLQDFHAYLTEHGFQAGSSRTVLDDPFLAYDWCLSLSLVLQALLWILILASLSCELQSRKHTSQAFSFAAGAVAVMSGLSVLVPNYAKMTNLTEAFRGCGPEFDRLMEFAVSGTLGMTFAVPLGLQIFGVLLTVPISAVRGLWFITIRPEMRNKRALHTGMWLVAFLIPFVTIFPLLFFTQLTEDSQSQAIIYVFWLLPSLRIISAGKTRSETWFYFGWLTLYCFLVGCFLGRQSWIMSLDVQSVIHHLDGPWLWSMMHADFCLTNVIITDLVCFVLGDMEEEEDVEAELELSKACMAVSKMPVGVTDEMQNLPGFQSARVVDGHSILDFASEAEARAASSHDLTDGRLVSLSSLVSLATSH
ncbi:unnamed protein product [Symbiodinium sp. CCMP2456]|nr:unnamed protein product [Symbiodinium sp. CCMP2456]